MERRPVVVQPPPEDRARRPVVVRTGRGKRDRRRVLDLGLGLLGFLLLVLAVALFGILPEDEAPPRQWQVSYDEQAHEVGDVQQHDFLEGQTFRFPLDIAEGTVHFIAFTVEWADDQPATDPDTFDFQIIAPNGDPLGTKVNFSTPPSVSDGNPVLPAFTAATASQVISVQVQDAPRAGAEDALDDEDAANAKARFDDALTTYAPGSWTLEVHLKDAGDCPAAGDGDPQHAAACEVATNQQPDTTNALRIVKVTFTTYEALIGA